MPRVLTALQPSGILHIGNYFGAIEPFVKLQNDGNPTSPSGLRRTGENFLFAVDYHAITVPQEPAKLRENLLFTIATYLASGVDPEKTILFQQSAVPQHTELTWILNCIAHMGELERMTQYKDKVRGKGESVTVGLFDYPVLMAADILLYDTEIVPVGEDQKQHVELARDLAERFNKRFGQTFVIPKPQIRKEGARIMALDDPESKMSKSSKVEKSFISLMDDAKTVERKIKSAVTDSDGTIVYDPTRKGLANLITLYALVTNLSHGNIEKKYEGKGYGVFKQDLAQEINQFLEPLQINIRTHLADQHTMKQRLASGAEKARQIAEEKMQRVRSAIGVVL